VQLHFNFVNGENVVAHLPVWGLGHHGRAHLKLRSEGLFGISVKSYTEQLRFEANIYNIFMPLLGQDIS